MSQDNFSFNFVRTYTDESGNKVLVYKLTDYSTGFSVFAEGIHEHKIKRKAMKKINNMIREEKRKMRNN